MKEKINVELFFLRIKNTFLYTTVLRVKKVSRGIAYHI